MIGNDIVDLHLAAIQSNWQRKGFLTKLFTEQEQAFILNSTNPFKSVWLLWSMKESAYKAHTQKTRRRSFNPKKLVCSCLNKTSGFVCIEKEKYSTTSKINDTYIHTVATQKNIDVNDNFYVESNTISNKKQPSDCYALVKTVVSEKLGFSVRELQIKKDKMGIPKIYHYDSYIPFSISVSHHGNYGAYAIINYKSMYC